MSDNIGGIILAGGEGKRFGSPKQLLLWRGKPFVRCVAETAISAGIAPLILVTGAYADQVAAAVSGLPLEVVRNKDWQLGQSTSLRKGLSALPEQVQAVVVFLVDMPQVTQPLVNALIERYAQTKAAIVAPWIGSRRGNPVLFDRSIFAALSAVEGDRGGRALYQKNAVEDVIWDDPILLLDVDTDEDYRRLQNASRIEESQIGDDHNTSKA